jgi:Xaa-Pro dipeptidase
LTRRPLTKRARAHSNRRYFPKHYLSHVFLPSPIHSRYINKDVLQRYLAVGGVRIEDDILVTADGYENLTKAPRGEEMLRIIRGDGAEDSREDPDTHRGSRVEG